MGVIAPAKRLSDMSEDELSVFVSSISGMIRARYDAAVALDVEPVVEVPPAA